MLILRIRQAEVAAGAGRLDEAFDIAARDGRFRTHRRGQDAITRIIASLVKRGREHLDADRMVQAAADCDKAGRLGGGDLPNVAQLTADLRAKQLGRQRGQREAALAVAAAKRHLEDGELSVGRRILANVTDDSRAKRLMDDIDDQRSRLDAALGAATAAADRRDWPAAAEAVARGRMIRSDDARVVQLATRVAEALSQQAQNEVNAGRLDRAAASAGLLRKADPSSSFAQDVDRALEHCGSAWTCLEQARPHDAAEFLRRVAILFPDAGWVDEALKQVRVASEAMAQLRAGPLALGVDVAMTLPAHTAHPARHDHKPVPPRHVAGAGLVAGSPPSASQSLPDRFILQVDGAGAFLVVRSAVAKVGPISSSALPDVALVADAMAPAVTIERVEDDYFLRAPSAVAVNDKPVTEGLLAGGDRIGLSPRCRFTFALPHPASTTAVLELDGARYPRADVRRVVLLDRDLVLGPSAAAHVRVSDLAEPVVLHLRGGTLRASTEATANGRPVPREQGLPVGVPVSAGGASFVISRV